MPSRKLWALLFSAVLVITTSLSLYGQSTYGTVDGSVLDSSGAAIADAQVTLTNKGTQDKRVQQTGAEGLFQFVNVFSGQYRLDIEKAGFKHFTRDPVVVEVQQDSHIVATLPVGQVTESVEVTAETPLLQVETSSLGQVVEQRKANELPLNGRNIFNLITISPAAVAQGGSGGTPVGQNPFSWGNYQVGGSFANRERRVSRRPASQYRLHQPSHHHSDPGFDRRIQGPVQQPGSRVREVLGWRHELQHEIGDQRFPRRGL